MYVVRAIQSLVFCLVGGATGNVYAHGGVPHHEGTNEKIETRPAAKKDLFESINKEYVATVKPIFQKSCFDCHSNETRYPWYYKAPVIRSVIDSDIEEAKQHLILDSDYPFKGHGSPVSDLQEIGKVIKENTMPPTQYRLMHWSSKLSERERSIVLGWVSQSLEKLDDLKRD